MDFGGLTHTFARYLRSDLWISGASHTFLYAIYVVIYGIRVPYTHFGTLST